MNFNQLQKAIDILREGIQDGNMEQIKEGFYELTGEAVEDTATESSPEEVSAGVRVSEQAAPSKDLDFSVEPRQQGKTRLGRKEAIVVGENQFVDDRIEASDVTTPEVPLTPRRRTASKTVSKTCHVCNKTFDINPALVGGEFFRSDSCITNK